MAFDDLDASTADASNGVKRARPASPQGPTAKQTHRNEKRRRKRQAKVQVEGHSATPRTLFEHVQLSESLKIATDIKDLPVASGAYSALHLKEAPSSTTRDYTLAQLLEEGFTLVKWDGW